MNCQSLIVRCEFGIIPDKSSAAIDPAHGSRWGISQICRAFHNSVSVFSEHLDLLHIPEERSICKNMGKIKQ